MLCVLFARKSTPKAAVPTSSTFRGFQTTASTRETRMRTGSEVMRLLIRPRSGTAIAPGVLHGMVSVRGSAEARTVGQEDAGTPGFGALLLGHPARKGAFLFPSAGLR